MSRPIHIDIERHDGDRVVIYLPKEHAIRRRLLHYMAEQLNLERLQDEAHNVLLAQRKAEGPLPEDVP